MLQKQIGCGSKKDHEQQDLRKIALELITAYQRQVLGVYWQGVHGEPRRAVICKVICLWKGCR